MNILRLQTVIALCLLATSTSADDKISEQESQRYYFGLMQKARSFKLEPNTGRKYLRGVWRLDQKAHVGGGHYTRADKGDDVSLICNDARLMQVDFNRHSDKFREVTEQLAALKANADGSLSIGKGRRYIPLDDNYMAVAAYDYIVVLQRVSGRAKSSEKKEGKPTADDSKD